MDAAVPYATAIIGFGLSMFQIYLPPPEKDFSLENASVDLVPFIPPTISMLKSKECSYSTDIIYLNDATVTYDEEKSVRFNYGSRIKM